VIDPEDWRETARVTEMRNPITAAIDEAEPAEIVRLLGEAEAEIFGSPVWGRGLFEPRFLEKLIRLRREILETLAEPTGRILIGGAGTSGRLAVHAAVRARMALGADRAFGLLAGGLDAMYRAKENIEDQPHAGARDLAEVLPETGPFVYIGVSCGLSAAYVAGQAALAAARGARAVAVLGFNPPGAAADRPLPDLNLSFRELLRCLTGKKRLPSDIFGESVSNDWTPSRFHLLTAIIGPEPIAGSTRMKGGTATKLILDALLFESAPDLCFRRAQSLRRRFDAASKTLAPAIVAAATALRQDRRFWCLADARTGLMALLDASECPPTFGAAPDQAAALVEDGFAATLPGFDMSERRLTRFAELFEAGDAVFALTGDPSGRTALEGARRQANVPLAQWRWLAPTGESAEIWADLPPTPRLCLEDLWLKWTLNAISTGAFIGYGKVYGGRMIDLRVSNLKLWERACRILTELTGAVHAAADTALRRAIAYDDPELTPAPPERLIQLAVRRERVLPRAALILLRGATPAEADALLANEPRLKRLLAN